MNTAVKLLNFSNKESVKLILQTEAAECGLAVLAMVLNFHGHKIDLNSLRQKFPISQNGASLKSIITIANKCALSSRALRVEINELVEVMLPCILHWKMNHFVVLSKVSKNKFTIYDPASGEGVIGIGELSDHFTGIALELFPANEFRLKDETRRLKISDLWQRITGLKRSLIQIFGLSLLLQLFVIVTPFYMQLVVDEVIISHDENLLLILSMGFFLLLIFNVAVTALRSFVVMSMSAQLNMQIAHNLFRHLIHLPLDWFQKRHVGDIISRFASIDQVKQLLTNGLVEAVVDGLMLVGTVALMFIYNAILAWVVLTVVCIYLSLRLLMYKPLRRRNEESIIANAKEDSNFIETVRASQSIKLFNKETDRQNLWLNLYADVLNTGIKLNKLSISYNVFKGLLFGVENILVIYISANSVINGTMSVGMLYAFIAYKSQFISKSTALIEKLIQFKMLQLHLSRLSDIVHTPIEEDIISNNRHRIDGTIQLERLTFNYSGTDSDIIRDVNLSINSGESVAIIGGSGCGKSTLMKLMLGLYAPTKGRILVDNIEINQLGMKNYRQQIAAVMQDDQLLSGSITDNISFFDPKYKQAMVEGCAKTAAIHNDIIALPMGYNSLIGDMGSSLSGGQKQRILLARALYKKPKILFLDEATSHLDAHLEQSVNKNIKFLKMTRVIIAHREETINSADRVLLLKNGRLSEIKSRD